MQRQDDRPIRRILGAPKRLLNRLQVWWLQKRWEPLLRQLQREFAHESEANKVMLHSYRRWLEGKADPTELHNANHQFRELLKTLGVGGLLILPFSPITLPWVLFVADRLRIPLLPAWFGRLSKPSSHSKL